MKDVTKEELTILLKETEKAHAAYEKKSGTLDPDWAKWYAEFMIDRLS